MRRNEPEVEAKASVIKQREAKKLSEKENKTWKMKCFSWLSRPRMEIKMLLSIGKE